MMRSTVVLLVVSTLSVAASDAPATQASGPRTIFVSAIDGKGLPVLDLTASEFVVKEDGKAREVTAAALATSPLQVALMVDDSGRSLQFIREGAASMVLKLRGRADIAIITTSGRNLTLVDFTSSTPTLIDAINRMAARNQSGAFLLDGFIEVSQAFMKREAQRPVIVALSVPTEENSNVRPDAVLAALQKSHARFYLVELGAPTTVGMGSLGAKADDAAADDSSRRNAVLGKAPDQSGGRAQQVVAPSGIPVVMGQIADELLNQYAVTYVSTIGATSSRLTVEVKRKGIKARAPARIGGN